MVLDESQPLVSKKFGFDFRFRNLPVHYFFGIIDPCLRFQLFKSKYFDNKGLSTGENFSFVAFMEEFHSVVLEENDFDYRE